MSLADIKKELHEYIDEADVRLLNLIYGMVLADQQSNEAPDWHQKVIEERLVEYEKNPDNVIAWEEVKSKIEKMK